MRSRASSGETRVTAILHLRGPATGNAALYHEAGARLDVSMDSGDRVPAGGSMTCIGGCVLAVFAIGSLARDALAADVAGEPQNYMRKLGFSEAEITDLEKGKVV